MSEVFEKLNLIFRDFFDDEDIVVKPETVASDIVGWDSLEHITLMAIIEEEFHVEFDLTKTLSNVGEMAKEIERQMGERK